MADAFGRGAAAERGEIPAYASTSRESVAMAAGQAAMAAGRRRVEGLAARRRGHGGHGLMLHHDARAVELEFKLFGGGVGGGVAELARVARMAGDAAADDSIVNLLMW
eukprot:CAMPEP_0181101608 /NCGR_PEP_ID=MMETSP1071-20121207/13850_1 /TAXON_ID=35127 /ORGANISM="Thalassiosira sp., Strain NH16" /LENGTH=107 /DNA_ID=CAMNT_0023184481 /DNA_START=620 /DNA_END=944 /DNA_ORIENTATION=-